MVATIGGLIVDPNGQTLVVDLTTAGGVRPTAYTAAQGSSTHTLPVTITTRTEFHLTQPLLLTVSVKRNGVEIASQVGTTTTVDVQPGVVQVVTPSINAPGPEGQADLTAALAVERAASNAAYAPIGGTITVGTDYATIQAALTAATAGKKIRIPAGLAGSVYTTAVPWTLTGVNNVQIVLDPFVTLTGTDTDTALFSITNCTGTKILGPGRLTGPGKGSAILNGNGITLTNSPRTEVRFLEIDGFYHACRPDANSTGLVFSDNYVHDCAFSAVFPHAKDRIENNRFEDIGTNYLHHDIYVASDAAVLSGLVISGNVHINCAGAGTQIYSESTEIVGVICKGETFVGCNAGYAIGRSDLHGCVFSDFTIIDCDDGVQGDNVTVAPGTGVSLIGNVYGCRFSGVIDGSSGRNIDASNNSTERPHLNQWDVVTTGGSDPAASGGAGATNMFTGNDRSIFNLTVNAPGYDCVRLSGSHYNRGSITANGAVSGDGLRFSGASHDNDIDLNSSGQSGYDLTITPNTCVNNTVRGRGASHATLAQNLFVAAGTTGLNLDQFTPSFSGGASGPIRRNKVAVLTTTSGAITFDAREGEILYVSLTGNMTSATWAGLYALLDDGGAVISSTRVTVIIKGNGFTVIWPTATYVGATAPVGTAETSVTFWYDGTNARELSRQGDQAEKLWLSSRRFAGVGGSASENVLGSSAAKRVTCWLLDASTEETIGTTITDIPSSWATFDADIYWTNGAGGSGDVVWSLNRTTFGDTESTDADTAGSNVTATAPVLYTVKVTSVATGIAVPAANKVLRLTVHRVAADVADTLANDAALIGVMLKKAS